MSSKSSDLFVAGGANSAGQAAPTLRYTPGT
jgi:hypothetical protein